jgi:hypothetical protein
MSNLTEPPPPLTEKLNVKKVLQSIGVGIFILSNIVNSICIAVIFIYLGSTIPVLEPYACYVAVYTLWARTAFFICVFLIGCYWCCLRLLAPKQAGSSISKCLKAITNSCETLSNRELGRVGRTFFVIIGIYYTFNALNYCFGSPKVPELSMYRPVICVSSIINAACSIRVAYVGRISIRKGNKSEDMTMGNDDSQPESDETAPAGEYRDNDTTTQ